jgi:hypothetical protein
VIGTLTINVQRMMFWCQAESLLQPCGDVNSYFQMSGIFTTLMVLKRKTNGLLEDITKMGLWMGCDLNVDLWSSCAFII